MSDILESSAVITVKKTFNQLYQSNIKEYHGKIWGAMY